MGCAEPTSDVIIIRLASIAALPVLDDCVSSRIHRRRILEPTEICLIFLICLDLIMFGKFAVQIIVKSSLSCDTVLLPMLDIILIDFAIMQVISPAAL
jgi:hypothetical protein